MEKRGTYRWLSLMLALVFVLGLAGCAPEGSSSSESESESSEEEVSIYTPTDEILELQRGLHQVISQNGLDLIVYSKISGSCLSEFTFWVGEPDKSTTDSGEKTIVGRMVNQETGISEKSWEYQFDFGDRAWLGRNLLTAAFLWADPSMDLATAEEQSKNLLYNYDRENMTEPVECGDYLIYLVPYQGDIHIAHVYAKSELQGFADLGLYRPIDYEEACQPDFYGHERYWLSGRVTKVWEKNESSYYEKNKVYYMVEADDGHIYEVRHYRDLQPFLLEEGKRYLFYGQLLRNESENPLMSITYWEPLE